MTKIVRTATRNGPCTLLGRFEHETGTRVVYTCRGKASLAYIPRRLVHLEPCPSCPDHDRSRFGNLAGTMLAAVLAR